MTTPHATFIVGDVFDGLAAIPDGSIDLVLTSPPFLALRSYLPADDPDKGKEIGTEPTPADYLDTLLTLTAEFRRVIAPHGSIAVELGDTYSGSGGAGGDYNKGGAREGSLGFVGSGRTARDWAKNPVNQATNRHRDGWPLTKSLCGVPHLYHLSLAYGRNILTGAESKAGQWRVRNVVAWCRPNPPVGALGDKFRPATSYLTIACTDRKRYFDLDAVRRPAPRTDNKRTTSTQYAAPGQPERRTRASDDSGARIYSNPGGAPPLDWWEIPTQPYKGSHYATWPERLIERPLLSMVPERVCATCGEPSRRTHAVNPDYEGRAGGPGHNNAIQGASLKGFSHKAYAPSKFLPDGWSDCGHDAWRNGVVLDPFAGSGTTLKVATNLGRDAIGIDLDRRNVTLARRRVDVPLHVGVPT